MKRADQPIINSPLKLGFLQGIILSAFIYPVIEYFTQYQCNDINFFIFLLDHGLFIFYSGLTIYYPILLLLFWYELSKERKGKVTSLDL